MTISAKRNHHWHYKIEVLHSVCTAGAKIMHKRDTKICYCPEKRTKPEAIEVAGQENDTR